MWREDRYLPFDAVEASTRGEIDVLADAMCGNEPLSGSGTHILRDVDLFDGKESTIDLSGVATATSGRGPIERSMA